MKTILLFGCALAISANTLFGAEADFKANAGDDGVKVETKISSDDAETEVKSKPSGFKGTDLIGLEVRNLTDQKIGEISDFVLDLNQNRAVYAVVAAGGFLGIGGKQLAVPPGAFTVTNSEDLLLWDANKDFISSAPAFDRHNWIAMADANFGRKVYAHYDQEPFWNPEITEAAGAEKKDADANASVEITAGDARAELNGQAKTDVTKTDATKNRPPGPGWERGIRPEGESYVEAARAQGRPIIGNVIRGSELIGMPVINKERTKLGEIKDVMVAMPSGKVQYAVLSSGGVLGVGDKMIAIPLADFTLSEDGEALLLYVKEETIKNAKGMIRNNWPESADANWRASAEAGVDSDPAGADLEVKADADLDKDFDDKLDFDLEKKDGAEAEIEIKKD